MVGSSDGEDHRRDPQNKPKGPSYFHRVERHLGRRMIAGFIVLVPLAVTYLILRLIVINLDDLFRPFAKGKLSILDFPGALQYFH